MEGKKSPEEELKEITERLKEHPGDMGLMRRRAILLQQTGRYGEALNEWLRVQERIPDDREAGERITYLQTILKYTNLDIFSDPNTHHDPWLE
jgi:hypothetical protein